jgi:hypothetical protein
VTATGGHARILAREIGVQPPRLPEGKPSLTEKSAELHSGILLGSSTADDARGILQPRFAADKVVFDMLQVREIGRDQ